MEEEQSASTKIGKKEKTKFKDRADRRDAVGSHVLGRSVTVFCVQTLRTHESAYLDVPWSKRDRD